MDAYGNPVQTDNDDEWFNLIDKDSQYALRAAARQGHTLIMSSPAVRMQKFEPENISGKNTENGPNYHWGFKVDRKTGLFISEPFTVAVNLAFLYHITHAFAEGIESYIRMRTQIWHHQLSDFSCEVICLKHLFLGLAYNIPDGSQGFIGEQPFFKSPLDVHLTEHFQCQLLVSLVIHIHKESVHHLQHESVLALVIWAVSQYPCPSA